jgi:hypothetical protein
MDTLHPDLLIPLNDVPATELGTTWMDRNRRPEEWWWHTPLPEYQVQSELRPMPEEFQSIYHHLLTWLAQEAAFAHLYNRPQISHAEYLLVVEWCVVAEQENQLEVPAGLSPCFMNESLLYLGWGNTSSDRWPQFIQEQFRSAGWRRPIQKPVVPVKKRFTPVMKVR